MQIQGPDGTWKDLLLSQGQIAILAGYTLERATRGLVKAAKHKVVRPAPFPAQLCTAEKRLLH